MHEIKYEIGLNSVGRPFIDLPDKNELSSEDKFFAIEIIRILFFKIYQKNDVSKYNGDLFDKLGITLSLLEKVSDEMANIIISEMISMGEVDLILDKKYHVQVKSIEDRNNLPNLNILFNNKLYNRQEGLKVLVTDEMIIYKLIGGIENSNWKEIE